MITHNHCIRIGFRLVFWHYVVFFDISLHADIPAWVFSVIVVRLEIDSFIELFRRTLYYSREDFLKKRYLMYLYSFIFYDFTISFYGSSFCKLSTTHLFSGQFFTSLFLLSVYFRCCLLSMFNKI